MSKIYFILLTSIPNHSKSLYRKKSIQYFSYKFFYSRNDTMCHPKNLKTFLFIILIFSFFFLSVKDSSTILYTITKIHRYSQFDSKKKKKHSPQFHSQDPRQFLHPSDPKPKRPRPPM